MFLKFAFKEEHDYTTTATLPCVITVRTICGQDDSDVLLAEGADSEQHGWSLGGDEAQGHVLSGSAVRGGGGGLRASVLHH